MAQIKTSRSSDPLLVAVLKLLPERVRERFCYVALGGVLIVVVVGALHAPTFTAVSGSGITVLYWLSRLLGR